MEIPFIHNTPENEKWKKKRKKYWIFGAKYYLLNAVAAIYESEFQKWKKNPSEEQKEGKRTEKKEEIHWTE